MLERYVIEPVTEYTERLAEEIGRELMPALTPGYSGEPVSEHMLRPSIESPLHDLVIARSETDGRIVGAATLSQIISFELQKPEAWLGGFSRRPDLRGRGVGRFVWEEFVERCRQAQAHAGWTSNPNRDERLDAIHFYEDVLGARKRNTNVYHIDLKDL